MPDLVAQPGELHFTIQVTRAATGKVDEYQMVGHIDPAKLADIQSAQPLKENKNGSNTQ